jgi:DNA-binding NarL/FixJ family response regulator
MTTIRVLLVDDEELIRAGLRAILEAEPDLTVVGEAADGAEVPAAVGRLRPDVVLMDVLDAGHRRHPGHPAALATPTPPVVLVLTTFENDDYVYDAL